MASNPVSETKAVDALLSAAKLATKVQGELKSQFSGSALLSSAGWHGPTDIKTLVGLEGQFLWPEDIFNVGTIRFTFDLDKIGFEGDYQLVRGWSVAEQGRFHSVPNNPAIGFAAISLIPQLGAPRTFVVSGMTTDNEWKIYVAVLNRLGDSGPMLPPFSAVRIS